MNRVKSLLTGAYTDATEYLILLALQRDRRVRRVAGPVARWRRRSLPPVDLPVQVGPTAPEASEGLL